LTQDSVSSLRDSTTSWAVKDRSFGTLTSKKHDPNFAIFNPTYNKKSYMIHAVVRLIIYFGRISRTVSKHKRDPVFSKHYSPERAGFDSPGCSRVPQGAKLLTHNDKKRNLRICC
jgi:hypothetical protein